MILIVIFPAPGAHTKTNIEIPPKYLVGFIFITQIVINFFS